MNIDIPAESIITPEFEAALQRSLEKVLPPVIAKLGTAQPDKLLLSADEAAKVLSICTKSLWSQTIPRGTLPAAKIGSRVLYSPSDLQAWIDSQKTEEDE